MKKTQKSLIKRLLAGILALMMIVGILMSGAPAFAAGLVSDAPVRVVRVGYTSYPGFYEGDAETHKTGSGYEYLQRISYLTGWEYEYVYGSFSDLIEMLEKGEIDLMGNVSKTEEREKTLKFSSYPEGKELFYLYCLTDRGDLMTGGLDKLEGSKIGVMQNSYQMEVLERWLTDHEIHAEVVYCNGRTGVQSALDKGLVDYGLMTKVDETSRHSAIMNVGYSEYYFAMPNDRTDLMKELNEALHTIQNADPFFNDTVYSRYNHSAANLTISPKEREWLNQHSELVVGYVDDYLPFCGTAPDGHVTGVITVIMKKLVSVLGLQKELAIHYQAYPTYTELVEGLQSGDVDIAFPTVSDFWYSEQMDMMEAYELVRTSVGVIYHGMYSADNIHTLAVSRYSPMQTIYAELYYPECQLVVYETQEECFDAIHKGTADGTLFNTSRAEYFLSFDEYKDLHFTECADSVGYCFSLRKDDNALLSLLNRGITAFDDSYVFQQMNNFVQFNNSYTIMDFVMEHFVASVIAICVVVTLGVSVVALVFIKRKAERDAVTDQLTGCRNRLALKWAYEGKGRKRGGSIAVIMCDLNGLKRINDNEGHDAGDMYIYSSGKLLTACFGKKNVYRVGGDEFVVVLTGLSELKVGQMVEYFNEECFKNQISVSLGRSFRKSFDEPFTVLFKEADSRMYQAKKEHYTKTGIDRRRG